MSLPPVTCAVLGDGGWGTALAMHLHRRGHAVRWWGVFPEYLRALDRARINKKFLPGVPIPQAIRIVPELVQAIDGAGFIFIAVPSQHFRSVVQRLRPLRPALRRAVLISAAKGLEAGSLLRMSEVIHQELGPVPLAALSGPSIASEVARGLPASLVAASARLQTAKAVQRCCMDERLRIYTSSDVAGVELGGALKNPMAIAAGVCDGLQLGSNAKAALIARAVVEMARLGSAMGARVGTFWGLSGLGDLVTTCFSGRNRWLGEQLGRGRSLRATLASTPMVIEGVETARAAVALGRRCRVELPILEQMHAILFRRKSPRLALQGLMRRTGKPEAP